MKKIVSVFLIVLIFCLAIPMASAEEAVADYVPPKGIQIYYANDISGLDVPVIDGVINDGEYGPLTVNIKDHLTMTDSVIDSAKIDEPCADSFDYYFAYDDSFIYIAYVDYGGTWEEGSLIDNYIKNTTTESVTNYVSRNNYYLNLGFFLDDLTSNFNIGCSSRGWDESRQYDFGKSQGTIKDVYEIVSEIYMIRTLKDDPTKVVSKGDGKVVTNQNSLEGPYIATVEIKLEKAQLMQFISDRYFINFEELPNAMYFEFTGRSYVLKNDGVACEELTSYNKYFVTPMGEYDPYLEEYGLFAGTKKQHLPGLIVFGDENTKIVRGVEKEYVPVIGTSDSLETRAELNTDTLPPEVSESTAGQGGCGSTVSFVSIVLVAALGTCTAFVVKKKGD